MVTLGIESTAHTFGIAIIDGKEILSNVTDSYTTEEGGMIPVKVALHHEEVYRKVLDVSLEKAGKTMEDITLIVYSNAPGLGHALRIGHAAAKSLSMKYDLPLVGVNHCIAHLEIANLVTDAADPVLLYASGANTQIIAYDEGKYRVFGETLDIGIGNFVDTFARNLGLGFPGGPKVEQLALNGSEFIELPYTVKGMDISFSGLETHTKRLIPQVQKEDLAFSVQEHVFAMLVEVAERAMAHIGKNELVLGGGVACNKRLQEMCKIMCSERNAKFFCPENQYLVDNAAMIAWTGQLMYEHGITREGINPYERTDEVAVTWRS
ncbi:MAG: KEOPS complex N(6)-L-threonylcarbamoyladenine synthase Kae1 [Candidatus Woesearchaeota archaeon]|nr:KEOPS complex N(6)-L-threonylcarbamoyladenine synthase Kae1 [Candidatus Woesearchaeota archaeon]